MIDHPALPGAEPVALDRRGGLPEALQVLVRDYPRDIWERHGNFDGLTRFWMERHLGFRDLLGTLTADTQAYLDNRLEGPSHARRLARFGNMLVDGLHGHHGIEDAHYFPLLAGLEPRLARGFALLDADHHALDGHLQTLTRAANAHMGALGQGDPGQGDVGQGKAAALLATLDDFARFLDRHLTDEEDLIVPVILHHGLRS